jgi:hypothetical protein
MEPHRHLDTLPAALRRQVFWQNPLALRSQYGRWQPENEQPARGQSRA